MANLKLNKSDKAMTDDELAAMMMSGEEEGSQENLESSDSDLDSLAASMMSDEPIEDPKNKWKESADKGEEFDFAAQRKDKKQANIVSAVLQGLQESVLPFTVEKGENEEEVGDSTTDQIAYAASNILGSLGAGIGVGALTGAAAGSIIPGAGTAAGLIGGGLWGLYSGLGQDRLRAIQKGKEWDPLSKQGVIPAALAVGLEINPIMKSSSKLVSAVRAAGQVAGSAGYEALQDSSKEQIGLAAALSSIGAISAMRGISKSPKAAQAIADSTFKGISEAAKETTPGLYSKVLDKLKDEDLELPEELPTNFKRFMLSDDGTQLSSAKLEEAWGNLSQNIKPEKLADNYKLFKIKEIQNKVIKEEVDALDKTYKHQDINVVDKWVDVIDAVATKVDKITGLETKQMFDKLNQSYHAYHNAAYPLMKTQDALEKQANKLGFTGKDVSALIRDPANLSDSAKAIIKKNPEGVEKFKNDFKTHTDGLYAILDDLGYSPKYLENYLPESMLSGADLSKAVDDVTSDLTSAMQKEGMKSVNEVLANPKSESFKYYTTLNEASERFGSEPIKTKGDIQALQNKIMSASEDKKKEMGQLLPSQVFSRNSELPEALREGDAWKLLNSYVGSGLKAAYLEDAIRMGTTYVGALEKLKMPRAAEVYQNALNSALGGGRAVDSVMKNVKLRLEKKGSEWMEKNQGKLLGETAGKTVKALPEFVSWLNSTAVPSRLMFNVKGALQNFSAFATSTIPEIGAKYGPEVAIRAARRITKEGMPDTKALNLSSDHYAKRYENLFKGARTADKAQNFIMQAYTSMDTMNRAYTYMMGKPIAEDIMAGKKRALSFLRDSDPTLKAQVRRALVESKDPEKTISDLIGRHLVTRTQFNTQSHNKAEWAKAAGPLFTQFTSFTNSIGSDLKENVMGTFKGDPAAAKKLLTKYAAPYALLMAYEKSQSEQSDMGKYLIGKPTSWSLLDPVLSMAGKGKLEFNRATFLTPGVGKVISAAGEAVIGDTEAAGKSLRGAVKEGASSTIPVASAILNEVNKIQKIKQGESKIDTWIKN